MNDIIRDKLKLMISKERYEHSLEVQKVAVELAKKYNADIDKAYIAGLVHDCAKDMSNNELLNLSKKYNIEINDVSMKQPELLHGPVGAVIAQREFLINDEEILHSIKYHTTGCKNMSILDKIIYVADYIEPGRSFPGVDALRKETYENIDRGVLLALNNTIKYVIERGWLIDISTIEARNYMISYLNFN